MIIQTLQAENLFKYKSLSLSGLPASGCILVSGPNESGKTAIVETLCLGLFGRTAALEAIQRAKAVRWGEGQGSVTVTFLGSDSLSYTVSRHLESTGDSQATLTRTGETEPLAVGVEAVDQAVVGLIDLTFQHYVETLFLAQNSAEGSAREATIQALAGVTDLNDLADTLRDEMVAIQGQIGQVDREMVVVKGQLATLNLQEGALGRLEGQRQEAVTRCTAIDQERDRWQRLSADLQRTSVPIETATDHLLQSDGETTLNDWQGRAMALGDALRERDAVFQAHQVEMDAAPGEGLRTGLDDLKKRLSQAIDLMQRVANYRHQQAVWLGDIPGREQTETLLTAQVQIHEALERSARRRRRVGLSAIVTLFFALLLGAVGGIEAFHGESGLAQLLTGLLTRLYAGWHPSFVPLLWVVAVLFLLSALDNVVQFFWLRFTMAGHDRDLETLDERAAAARQRIQVMDAAAQDPLPRQVAALCALTRADWCRPLTEWANGAGMVLLNEGQQKALLAQWQRHLDTFRQEVADDAAEIAAQQEAAQAERRLLTERILQWEGEIEQEKGRRAQDRAWRDQQAALVVQRQGHLHQIVVRQRGCDLLQGACRELSIRFNRELHRFIAKAVPLFTQGRYQQVRIDDDLQVTAFSSVKNDFIDFNEISTGVRYQLLLAVRVALAQALAARVGRSAQMIVLDEPFVFFDRQRVRESLEALRCVSEQITQVWVIAQAHEEGVEAAGDLLVRCGAEEDSLMVQGLTI